MKQRNRWSSKQLKRGWKEDKPGHWICECDRFVLEVSTLARDASGSVLFGYRVFDPLGAGGRETPVWNEIAGSLEGAKLGAQRAARELGL